MVQCWQETDPKEILQGQDENRQIVSFIHEYSAVLQRMAVFDVLVNTHVRAKPGGHRYSVDHGLTFHHDWIGEELRVEELEGVDRLLAGLEGEHGII